VSGVSGAGRREEPLPQGEDKARRVRAMFDSISGRYDLVNRVMTLGMDVGWRRRAIEELRLPSRALVLDLACGTGDLCEELSRERYRPMGVDFSLGMLRRARERSSVPLLQADVLRLPVRDAAADGITCGFALRNVVSLEAFFGELGRVVRPGGRVSLLDVSRPDQPLLRAGHTLYFERVVPVIGGVLSDREAYGYLPRSMGYLPDPELMIAMLRGAGFGDAERTQLSGGIVQLLTGTRT
jgi:demethylmenaquinone methyltransferase/2-methoxy-6-polyprenyl-1,4-benzoquinol methylase